MVVALHGGGLDGGAFRALYSMTLTTCIHLMFNLLTSMALISPTAYNDYSGWRQTGRGLPIFKGSPYQRGHGFGGLLSSLIRAAIPLGRTAIKAGAKAMPSITKAGGKALVRRAVKTAVPTIKQSGKKMLKHAVSKGMEEGLKMAANALVNEDTGNRKRKHNGGGGQKVKIAKRGHKKPRKSSATARQKKATPRSTPRSDPHFDDIFD